MELNERTPVIHGVLKTDEGEVLEMIGKAVGTGKVTPHKIEGIFAWVM